MNDIDRQRRSMERKFFAPIAKTLITDLKRHSNDVGKQLKILNDATDGIVGAADEIFANQLELPVCKSGCALCCDLGVSVNPEEVFNIGDKIGASPELKEKIITSIKSRVKERTDCESISQIAFKKIPCVFLSAEKTCSIYTIRPTNCRTHASNDLKYCENPDTPAPVNPIRFMTTGYMNAFLSEANGKSNDPTSYELETCLLEYWENPASSKKRHKRQKNPFVNAKRWVRDTAESMGLTMQAIDN